MVKVSVVMPVYNAEEYLERTINSVFEQTLSDIEVICVDDGSTDNSMNILNHLAKQYGNIKVYSQENQGSGKARNHGIDEASGEYIAFIDADDVYIDEDALEKLYVYGHKKDTDIVCGNMLRVTQDCEVEKGYNYNNTRFKYFNQKDILDPVEYGIPWAFYKNIYKKSFIDEHNIRFPDLLRGQDPLFLVNVLINVEEIYVTNTDLYGYNHSLGGGVNIKINTYQKKYDYIQHFKQTMDILEEANFETPLREFKEEFLNYIGFEDNVYDDELKKIVPEVFGDLDKYFNDDIAGYNYLKLLENNEVSSDFKEYGLIKKCLFEETLLNDNFISGDQLREYIKYKENHKENKEELLITSFNELKKIEQDVNRVNEVIKDELDEKKKLTKELNDENNKILTSNGWKATEFLRIMRNKDE
ncbi:MAG: glycosyltransferase [Methanosphaera sp.]|nr:glycosyltransferase [Methanosphaera sp.]